MHTKVYKINTIEGGVVDVAFIPLELKHDIKFVRTESFVILELMHAKKQTYSHVMEDRFCRMCPDIPCGLGTGLASIRNDDALNIFGKRALM